VKINRDYTLYIIEIIFYGMYMIIHSTISNVFLNGVNRTIKKFCVSL